MNDIEQRLASMNREQLHDVLLGLVNLLHAEDIDTVFAYLREHGLEETLDEQESRAS